MDIKNQKLSQQGTTRVFFKFNTPDYEELKFRHWTPAYLVVEYADGKPWRMGRNLVNKWLQNGVLKIEGAIPESALIM